MEQRSADSRALDAALAALEALPRLGWNAQPTPVDALPDLAAELKLVWLGCKRDDLAGSLCGGSKTRKLDYLLAVTPFRDAPRWASAGAIGSGHLVACTAAAQHLGRHLDAHLFWEPLSAGVVDNLSFTGSGPTTLFSYRSRISLALCRPRVLLGRFDHGVPVLPPGATHPVAMLGLVRAGIELALQVRAGLLPEPDRLVVALGSGGTAAGLALGLGIAGLRTRVHAVATVEWPLATLRRVQGLMLATRKLLNNHGLSHLARHDPATIQVDHQQIGPGYGIASQAALQAVQRAHAAGLTLEPVYTGKAFAGLLAAALLGQCEGERVLFWNTVRSGDPLTTVPQWRERLPPALLRRLERAEAKQQLPPPDHKYLSRRRFLLGGAALATSGLAVHRLSGYRLPGWRGKVLSERQALIVMAAADALLPPAPPLVNPAPAAPDFRLVASGVDLYLQGLPIASRREVALLLTFLEQATTPLGGYPHRLTRLPVAERRAFLASLQGCDGQLADAAKGVRDLVMLGYYQRPESWQALGYPLPPVAATPRPMRAAYASLLAPAGAVPGTWPARRQ